MGIQEIKSKDIESAIITIKVELANGKLVRKTFRNFFDLREYIDEQDDLTNALRLGVSKPVVTSYHTYVKIHWSKIKGGNDWDGQILPDIRCGINYDWSNKQYIGVMPVFHEHFADRTTNHCCTKMPEESMMVLQNYVNRNIERILEKYLHWRKYFKSNESRFWPDAKYKDLLTKIKQLKRQSSTE